MNRLVQKALELKPPMVLHHLGAFNLYSILDKNGGQLRRTKTCGFHPNLKKITMIKVFEGRAFMYKNCIKAFIMLIMIISICFSYAISSFAVNEEEIFYYDGITTTQITDNDSSDRSPQINNNGEIVWIGADDLFEIFYYDGTTIAQLTDNGYVDGSPQINNSGEIVWKGGYTVPPPGPVPDPDWPPLGPASPLDFGGGGGGGGGG